MSGRKSGLKQFSVIAAGDMSTASLTSSVTDIRFCDDIGYQFTWTGSPVGTFQIQCSADHNQDTSSPANVLTTGNWVPLVLSYWDGTQWQTGTTIPTSVGSPVYVDLSLLSAPYIRCVYTKVSGTGTLTATVTGKMV